MATDKPTIRIKTVGKKSQPGSPAKRNISCQAFIGGHPKISTYIAQVERIMDEAKQTSSTVNLQFRKYSDKPQMQVVYVNPSKLQTKLSQMGTRIETNKYQMLIEVRSDPIDNLAAPKKIISDQIQSKNYDSIYKEYLKNQIKGQTLQIVDPLVSLYQFYDDQAREWKESLKNKRLIQRQIHKQTQKKILQSRLKKRKNQQIISANNESSMELQSKLSKVTQEYQKMFEQFVEQNKILTSQKNPSPKPQVIVTNLLQNKFYKIRDKKYENIFDRSSISQPIECPQQQILDNKLEQSTNIDTIPKTIKKQIKMKVPESCKKIYYAQNKLLEENVNYGLSRDNTKKLIIQFNKTILELKGRDGKDGKDGKRVGSQRGQSRDRAKEKKYKGRILRTISMGYK